MFDFPRCPVCRGELPVRELFRRAPRESHGIFAPRVGLRCERCQTDLVLQRWRAYPVVFGIYALVGLLLMFFIAEKRARSSPGITHPVFFFIGIFAAVVGVQVARDRLLQRCSSFRTLKRDETVDWTLTEQLRADRTAQIIEDAGEVRESADVSDVTAPWRCEKCGEENPPEFRICWKCETSIPERLLPKTVDD